MIRMRRKRILVFRDKDFDKKYINYEDSTLVVLSWTDKKLENHVNGYLVYMPFVNAVKFCDEAHVYINRGEKRAWKILKEFRRAGKPAKVYKRCNA